MNAVPDIPPGTVVQLRQGDWRCGGHPLSLRIRQLRPDLSRYYDSRWVWIIGESLDPQGASLGQVEVLVRVSALAGRA